MTGVCVGSGVGVKTTGVGSLGVGSMVDGTGLAISSPGIGTL